MIRVFTDYHHGDLYYSLHRLFEEQLGWELYRPIGLDWFHNGYWKIAEPYNNAIDTVRQYLDINNDGWIPFKNLNGQNYLENNTYFSFDPSHNYYHRAITFDSFKEMQFDIILPTYEPHERLFLKLRDLFHPKAKLVAQMGNNGQDSILPNVIHSVPYVSKINQKAFYYHQEIDLSLYTYQAPDPNHKKIYSVVHLYPYPQIWKAYKEILPEVEMKNYGSGCPDGVLSGPESVSQKMREASCGWHLKPQGGLGHSSLGWLASGRPVITNMSQMRSWGGDCLSLFEPGVTCIDIESYTKAQGASVIRALLKPEELLKWSERVYRRFNDLINYDFEKELLGKFFMEVLSD